MNEGVQNVRIDQEVADPINWKMLQGYIQALPDDVEFISSLGIVIIRNRFVSFLKLHNLIVDAIKCDSTNVAANQFVNDIMQQNIPLLDIPRDELQAEILHLSDHLSFKKNELDVTVVISRELRNLLHQAVANERYELQGGGNIKIFINYNERGQQQNRINQLGTNVKIATSDHKVTDIQALLALVVIIKCYPVKWQEEFFWDAWLAVTIQLGLLKRDNEVFPCQWLKEVFYAERLIKDPSELVSVIMGQNPVSQAHEKKLWRLRGATGVAFHRIGNGNASIRGMTEKYKVDCTWNMPVDYCIGGTLLVNMIRCIQINDETMRKNSCYDAWVIYTVKIAKYIAEYPVSRYLLIASKDDSELVKYIKAVNENCYQVRHPSSAKVDVKDKEEFKKFWDEFY